MAVIEEAIYTKLAAAVTTAGARIYPVTLPAEPTFPAIVYTRVSTVRYRVLSTGFSHLARPRFQFICWAERYEDAKILANEIIAELDSYSGSVSGEVIQSSFADQESDFYEPTRKIYGVLVEFLIAHTE